MIGAQSGSSERARSGQSVALAPASVRAVVGGISKRRFVSAMKVVLVAVVLLVGACGDSEPASDQRAAVTLTATSNTSPSPTAPDAASTTVAPTTSVSYPDEINDTMEVEDGHYRTVMEMAHAADLVIVGDVVGVTSLGRPDTGEDTSADEHVAATIEAAEVLKGELVERVVLGWDAIQVDSAGNGIATIISNGIRPPAVGDRMLLFLDPASPSFIEALGGKPTHWPVLLDGVAYLDGDRLIAGETVSTTADQLLAMSLPQIRKIVHRAAEHPRDVGEPIQPGGL
jgi:hypothetical protein